MPAAVRLSGVGKRYRRYDGPRPDTLKAALLAGWRRPRRRDLWALRDVSFAVVAGRTVGLVGHNGAGKSTLLRLVGRVGRPDTGRVEVHGRLAALLELETAFHPELTGRESAVLAGVVAGLSRRDMRRRLDEVVAFAELEEFVDAPIRTYSSGMRARLAFAVACQVQPQVLLVDEVLAVGDLAFQQRCLARIRQFQRDGVTILLVSHDPVLVADLCDEVVWLRSGRLLAQGDPREVTARYRAAMQEHTLRVTPPDAPVAYTPAGDPLRTGENRFGSLRARVVAVHLWDAWGQPCSEIVSGAGLGVDCTVTAPVEAPLRLAVTLVRADGLLCVEATRALCRGDGDVRTARLTLERLDLPAGDYAVDVGLYDEQWDHTFDYHWRAYPLRVAGPPAGAPGAALAPPLRWG